VEADVARFHAGLAAFDAYLASGAPLACTPEKLFQGRLPTRSPRRSDRHAQAARGLAGEGEVLQGRHQIGRLGPVQTPPKRVLVTRLSRWLP
jgi:hypothetical protein